MPWFRDVPAALETAFALEAHAETMLEATSRLIKKRFSTLILMPLDQLDEKMPLPDFGVDSMIASEFRFLVLGCVPCRCAVLRYHESAEVVACLGGVCRGNDSGSRCKLEVIALL